MNHSAGYYGTPTLNFATNLMEVQNAASSSVCKFYADRTSDFNGSVRLADKLKLSLIHI